MGLRSVSLVMWVGVFDPANPLSVRKLSLAVKVRSHTNKPAHLSLNLLDKPSAPSPPLSLSLYLFLSFHSKFLSWHLFISRFNSLIYFCLFVSIPPSPSLSLSLSSGCQAAFCCMLYMHSFSMPSQIQRDSLISLSGGVKNKTKGRQINHINVRSRESDCVQTVRSKYRNIPGLGKCNWSWFSKAADSTAFIRV